MFPDSPNRQTMNRIKNSLAPDNLYSNKYNLKTFQNNYHVEVVLNFHSFTCWTLTILLARPYKRHMLTKKLIYWWILTFSTVGVMLFLCICLIKVVMEVIHSCWLSSSISNSIISSGFIDSVVSFLKKYYVSKMKLSKNPWILQHNYGTKPYCINLNGLVPAVWIQAVINMP